jgi:DNA-binding response OmpR family regulator
MSSSKILIVEDEEHLAEGLRFNLELEDYAVELAPDGETALQILKQNHKPFDAIVLDVMLPEMSGFEVAENLRSHENYTPILMLTALGKPEDVLRGFEAGADDYLPKPFELEIFLARLNGLLRRQRWFLKKQTVKTEIETFVINGKTIDFTNLELHHNGEKSFLTLMEAKLLRHLIENIGKTVSRKEILQDVWGLHEETDTRAIDNFIVRLRRYLEDDPTNPEFLLTIRGVGYRLNL